MAACTLAAASLLVAPNALADVRLSLPSGSTVSSPVRIDMSVNGMTVTPASAGLKPKTGHFHLFVDADGLPKGVLIPFDATHLHYGKGQTTADVELTPGPHVLTLQFANAVHESYGPSFASSVAIVVDEPAVASK